VFWANRKIFERFYQHKPLFHHHPKVERILRDGLSNPRLLLLIEHMSVLWRGVFHPEVIFFRKETNATTMLSHIKERIAKMKSYQQKQTWWDDLLLEHRKKTDKTTKSSAPVVKEDWESLCESLGSFSFREAELDRIETQLGQRFQSLDEHHAMRRDG